MEIADWRKTIDGLDEQIVRLLNERAAAAVEIGKLKQKEGAPIYEPNREQTVFEHVRRVNPGPLTAVQLQDIYYRVMDVMRALQRVDGQPGTHQGAERVGAQSSEMKDEDRLLEEQLGQSCAAQVAVTRRERK